MSTEHQQYSTANQADSIAEYAKRRGFRIVKNYADQGKSGLRIEGRGALQQLIRDVETDQAEFKAILVYDISRWGRFQDSDESAYYEYICRRAGIQVYYCAEQFENDGSPASTIIKGVKRAMAGEYSRELSAKVFQGQCRLIQLGYRQGGPAGYGLRRMLVGPAGKPKGILGVGEHKSLQTDRVILVPGPAEEIVVVERVYRLFTDRGETERQIASRLNLEGIGGERGRRWTAGIIRQLLTNEKYIGHNVYNRLSFKLKKKRIQNSPDMWIRKDDAFEAIIDPELFYMARGIFVERNRSHTDEELIAMLKGLLHKHGRLSASLIDTNEQTPSATVFQHRFGGLLVAYRLAGYDPGRDYRYVEINRSLRELHPQLLEQVVRDLERHGAKVVPEDEQGVMVINGAYRVSLVLSRYRETAAGSPRWLIRFGKDAQPDLTLMVRMDATNSGPEDYFLLPHLDVNAPCLWMAERNGAALDTYRFQDLTYFMAMAVCEKIGVAA